MTASTGISTLSGVRTATRCGSTVAVFSAFFCTGEIIWNTVVYVDVHGPKP
ncbi:hypothetical protein ACWGH5_15000 [Streptomyces sp. NPDC054864]